MKIVESRPASASQEPCLTQREAEASLQHLARIAVSGAETIPPPCVTDWLEDYDLSGNIQPGMDDVMYRMLLEQLPVVTFMARLGAEYNEIYVSPQIEVMLGFSQTEWLDNPVLWYERLHPDDKERWNVEFSRFLVMDEPFRSVYRFVARDGRVVWVHGEVRMIRDERGRPIIIQGVGYDVTELKEGEAEVQRARDELERRVEERTLALEERARELAETNAKLETEISERRRLEESLLHAQKMESIGKLAGGIAHEFNNMMTAILGFAEIASEKEPGDPTIKSDLREIETAARRTADLTGQLLAFARKQMIQPKIFRLNDLISDNSRILRRFVGERVDLRLHLRSDVGSVKADPSQLMQVLINLAVNAGDAMPAGGSLVIRAENAVVGLKEADADLPPGEYVLLTVSDTGVGMDEQTRAHIFEPFFTTKPVGRGTGLGLATCYGVIKQAGGHIEALSAPGEGATFRVYLPRMDAPPSKLDSLSAAPARNSGETVLIVEDEDQVRDILKRTLEKEGYAVLTAASAEEAPALADAHPNIALLVTDVVMPQMSGRELAERMRRKYPALKVMLISGYTEEQVKTPEVSGNDGEFVFLSKPFSPAALAAKARALLDADARNGG